MGGSLADLRERRDYECRLTPDRALETFDDARSFLRDRGLLTRTADCALPSLYAACHEEPYQAGGRGFASWPATKWPWAGELALAADVHAVDIHRGKNLLLSDEFAALADPICRAELARLERADPACALVLRHLATAGPAMADDLEVELGLAHKEMRAVRSQLQRCGALVARPVIVPAATGHGHLHRTELARWDQEFPEPVPPGAAPAFVALVGAALRAAVLAPERDLVKWFTWSWLRPADLGDQLVGRGLAVRPEPGWLAAPDAG